MAGVWCPSCRATVSVSQVTREKTHYYTQRDEIRAVGGQLQGTIERQVPVTKQVVSLVCSSCGKQPPDLLAPTEEAFNQRRERRVWYRLALVPAIPVAFVGGLLLGAPTDNGLAAFGLALLSAYLVQFPLQWLIRDRAVTGQQVFVVVVLVLLLGAAEAALIVHHNSKDDSSEVAELKTLAEVVVDRENVRERPAGKIIGKVKRGDKVTVRPEARDSPKWVPVECCGGRSGYIWAESVRVDEAR